MPDSTPTTLYRLFAANGDLLYVGIAGNPGRRFEQHRSEKPWWGEVVGATLEHFSTRKEALDAETVAISDERPRHNHTGRPTYWRLVPYSGPVEIWTAGELTATRMVDNGMIYEPC